MASRRTPTYVARGALAVTSLLLLGALACHSHAPDSPACDIAATRQSLQQAMRDVQHAHPGNAGWLMSVRIPSAGLEFSGAAQAPEAESLAPGTPFRIASVTKTFMAAAILRLVEDDTLSLDDTVAEVVPPPYPELLRAHGYAPERMTIAHLLTHTSGLFDYAQSDDYLAAVLEEPARVWTREEQVRFAMEHGAPVGAPGERYMYSDTGYLLLGAVLETRMGWGLARAYRSLLGFERLGLQATWLEKLEPPPTTPIALAPQALDGFPLANIDATADLFGGGGLVSNTADLSRWFQALFAGEVFTQSSTLDVMKRVPATNTEDGGGMGIFRLERADGSACWLHEGFWGVAAMVCPDLDVSVAVAGMDATRMGTGVTDLLRAAVKAGTDCADIPSSSTWSLGDP
ncbi:beta-lactamase family protein [Myxococcus stipitatus]|uniref:serine hydrolase domain-containing protein n=1 Tax=Myxococcus stipitatus TaxID=83455 RepID=UPI001F40E18A|nr:serine hydrolase domain-containing protein [Myxococcus stipitatus]MCE9669947.1 beta-lactamase family protein [Myxococcus stipitatus]